jgi:hypothetical protein
MQNHRVYRAHVTVSVRPNVRTADGRYLWVPCQLCPTDVVEFVRSPLECGPLVTRVGHALAANHLRAADIAGFRVSARGVTTGLLCGMAEWRRTTTTQFEQAFEWAADWSDCPPGARYSAAYHPEAA